MDGNLELEVPFSEKLLFVRLIFFFNIEAEMKLGHTQTCTHTNNDDVELNHAWNPQPSACSHIHIEA